MGFRVRKHGLMQLETVRANNGFRGHSLMCLPSELCRYTRMMSFVIYIMRPMLSSRHKMSFYVYDLQHIQYFPNFRSANFEWILATVFKKIGSDKIDISVRNLYFL